ncbi:GNAT family N-acetyltransferase [Salarchaeum japonicum]|uniref:GNAT family N-acetyltransferase n=1 Tax=Salarchaeum japonicum TaxID=555573 RepID=UPI003C78FCD5
MTLADEIEEVEPEEVRLEEDGILGYNIYVCGEYASAIEGVPGSLEHLVVQMHWEGKGVGRTALRKYIELSRAEGCSVVTTNNDMHPAMTHILETECFEEQTDGGWEKEIQ